jgi:tRNA nucleotidyltransferase (CCA-adding enzyme)
LNSHRRHVDGEAIAARLRTLPALATIRNAIDGERAYLVGGAVRDLLLGAEHPDLDVAVEGDAAALARRLGGQVTEHERFATATVEADGVRVDLATSRRETYERPGALPTVEPAPIADDLARRDFSVNAMAVPLAGEPELIDPHGGLDDLRAGLLRALHDGSFTDDPTRALRAARYAARLGLELEPRTAELLAAADLAAVSPARVEAELCRIARESDPAAALDLLVAWRLKGLELSDVAPDRVRASLAVLDRPDWGDVASREEVVLACIVSDPRWEAAVVRLAAANPERPSDAVRTARGHTPLELVAGRAAGARWLDDLISTWRHVRLEIGGEDLLAQGVPEGRAIGRGLSAALEAKLDGDAPTRDDELRIALAAAGNP